MPAWFRHPEVTSTWIQPRSVTLRRIRASLLLILTIAVHGGRLAQSGKAADTPRVSRSMSSFLAAEAEMTGSFTRSSGHGSHSSTGTPERLDPPATAISSPRRVTDFYPMMRAGQGPNRNTVDIRGLCNPGRRALMRLQR